MRELPFPEKVYPAHDFVCHDRFGVYERRGPPPFDLKPHEQAAVQQLRENNTFYSRILAMDNLKLKQGAKVILLKNLDLVSDQRLVNGSVGTIIRWASGPNDVHYDTVLGGVAAQAAAMASGQQQERRSDQGYKDTYIERWLKQNWDKVPIVSGTWIGWGFCVAAGGKGRQGGCR